MTWFDEKTDATVGQRMLMQRLLYEEDTGLQRLQIFENDVFGRVLVLDDAIQVTERDEFAYHETLALPALFAHGAARRVLIVGGGDGGCLRQVLKHPAVELVVLVELDRRVIELCEHWLPKISANAFRDPRVRIVIADGAHFIATTAESFDLIIVDSVDPIDNGLGAQLHQAAFYRACRERCAPAGLVVTQCGAPFLQPGILRDSAAGLAQFWPHVAACTAAVPSYYGGSHAFVMATTQQALLDVSDATLQRRFAESAIVTRHYTPAIHRASFALPPWIAALMPDGGAAAVAVPVGAPRTVAALG